MPRAYSCIHPHCTNNICNYGNNTNYHVFVLIFIIINYILN